MFRDDSVPYQVQTKLFKLWMYSHVYSLSINLCKGDEEPFVAAEEISDLSVTRGTEEQEELMGFRLIASQCWRSTQL